MRRLRCTDSACLKRSAEELSPTCAAFLLGSPEPSPPPPPPPPPPPLRTHGFHACRPRLLLLLLPMRELPAMLNLCDEHLGQCYPNWLCPHIHRPMPGTIMPPPPQGAAGAGGAEMYVDLGVYGLPQCVKDRPVGHGFDMRGGMRVVEARLREIGGVEMLYADNYQTRDEFEQMFPHADYRRMRAKYGCEGVFPEVYQKINIVGVQDEPRASDKGHATASNGHATNGHSKLA